MEKCKCGKPLVDPGDFWFFGDSEVCERCYAKKCSKEETAEALAMFVSGFLVAALFFVVFLLGAKG